MMLVCPIMDDPLPCPIFFRGLGCGLWRHAPFALCSLRKCPRFCSAVFFAPAPVHAEAPRLFSGRPDQAGFYRQYRHSGARTVSLVDRDDQGIWQQRHLATWRSTKIGLLPDWTNCPEHWPRSATKQPEGSTASNAWFPRSTVIRAGPSDLLGEVLRKSDLAGIRQA